MEGPNIERKGKIKSYIFHQRPVGDSNNWVGQNLLPLENDRVVPIDSVFCRTSDPDDEERRSLMNVRNPQESRKYEYTHNFNHINFGDNFRLREFIEEITHGLSDWVVGRTVDTTITRYPLQQGEEFQFVEFASCEVEVEYNIFAPDESVFEDRESRDIDRLILVIYVCDEDLNWHVTGNSVNSDGTFESHAAISIEGNSTLRAEQLIMSTSSNLLPEDRIWDVRFELIPLGPDQNSVPLTPGGNFALP